MVEPILKYNTEPAKKSIQDLRAELKLLKNEMSNLEEGSDAFLEVANKAGAIKHQLDEINQSINGASADFGDIIGNISKVGAGFTGAFQSVSAGLDLMGVKSEEVTKSIKKMQDLMAITQGLSAIDNMNKSINKLRNSITATTGVAKVFKAVLTPKSIMLIVTAITALVAIWNKFGDSIKNSVPFIGNLSKKFQDLKKDTADATKEAEDYAAALALARNNLNEFLENKQVVKLNKEASASYKELADKITELTLRQKEYDAEIKAGADAGQRRLLEYDYNQAQEQINALKAQQQAILRDSNNYIEKATKSATEAIKEQNEAIEENVGKWANASYAEIEYNKAINEEYANSKTALEDLLYVQEEELKSLEQGTAEWYKLATAIEETKNAISTFGQAEQPDLNAAIDTELAKLDFLNESGAIGESEYWAGVIEQESIRLSLMQEQTQEWYNQATAIEAYKKKLEEANQKQKEGKTSWKDWTQVATVGINAVGDILGVLAEQQDTQTKEGFEKQKQLQIGTATMNMFSAILGAWNSAMALPAPASFIVGAIQTAATAVLGGIQIANIKKQKFEDGGSGANNSSAAVANTIITPTEYTTAVQGAEIESNIKDTKVWVSETDISNTQNKVSVQENESRY